MRHLNYNHLQYFWAVAREGSIAKASQSLHLTPQTISGQLKLLDEAVGQPLFNRVGRRLVLSDMGRVVFEYADEIFSLGAELANVVRGNQTSGPKTLTVGIVSSMPKIIAEREAQSPAERLREWIERKRALSARQPRRYPTLEEAAAQRDSLILEVADLGRFVSDIGSELAEVSLDGSQYTVIAESPAQAPDLVFDFNAARGDQIDVSAIDAISGTMENDEFIFVGDDAFSGSAGELRFVPDFEDGLLEGDINGDALLALGAEREGLEPAIAALANDHNWHLYMGFAGDTPACTGGLYMKDGVGYLDFGATHPDFRRRGGQTSLLNTRIRAALDAGCSSIVTMTGEAVPGDEQHSYRNIQRAGFKEAYLRENWIPAGS